MKNIIQIFITLILYTSTSYHCQSQSTINYNNLVGFSCDFEGEASKSVQKVSKLINKKDYKTIIELLDSKINAEKFLAVVISEKLVAHHLFTLTKKDIEQISTIYESQGQLHACSGCTYWKEETLKSMLEENNSLRKYANRWAEFKLKK